MLDWLTGVSRHGGLHVGNVEAVSADDDGPLCYDPPETPAPVFAVRALKTAIFGTPQETRHVDVVKRKIENVRVGRPTKPDAILTTHARSKSDDVAHLISPSKPTGILLTPGIGPSRRKTVSFGDALEQESLRNITRTGGAEPIEGCLDEIPSPLAPVSKDSVPESRRTKLTKILYESQGKGQIAVEDKSNGLNRRLPSKEQLKTTCDLGEEDSDTTLDMDEPVSTSGRYWKSEFEAYQERVEQEMKRLTKYKKAAKSYARKKDMEAGELETKLAEEKQKVHKLQSEISELTANPRPYSVSLTGDSSEPSRVVRDLIRQTALAREYKTKAEELERALERKNTQPAADETRQGRRYTSPDTEQTLIQTSMELKKARDQAKELRSLQEELEELRSRATSAELKAEKLAKANSSLENELERTKGQSRHVEQKANPQDAVRGLESNKSRAPEFERRKSPSKRKELLPPDRAAAAMARLQLKNQQRKRLQIRTGQREQ